MGICRSEEISTTVKEIHGMTGREEVMYAAHHVSSYIKAEVISDSQESELRYLIKTTTTPRPQIEYHSDFENAQPCLKVLSKVYSSHPVTGLFYRASLKRFQGSQSSICRLSD